MVRVSTHTSLGSNGLCLDICYSDSQQRDLNFFVLGTHRGCKSLRYKQSKSGVKITSDWLEYEFEKSAAVDRLEARLVRQANRNGSTRERKSVIISVRDDAFAL